jgi:hypothetical protein
MTGSAAGRCILHSRTAWQRCPRTCSGPRVVQRPCLYACCAGASCCVGGLPFFGRQRPPLERRDAGLQLARPPSSAPLPARLRACSSPRVVQRPCLGACCAQREPPAALVGDKNRSTRLLEQAILAFGHQKPSGLYIAREPLEAELCLSSLSSPSVANKPSARHIAREPLEDALWPSRAPWRRRPAAAAPGAARSRRAAAGRRPVRDRPACATRTCRPAAPAARRRTPAWRRNPRRTAARGGVLGPR